ncbi:hypothetical protein D3C80_762170 [compost metagenome]
MDHKAGVWQRVTVLFFRRQEDGDPRARDPASANHMHVRADKFDEVVDGVARFNVAALAVDVELDRIVADALQQDHLGDHFFRQRLVNFAGNNNRT